jgi:hypothetical protein
MLKRYFTFLLFCGSLAACKKNMDLKEMENPKQYRLSYGDSILYLKQSSGDHIINPVVARSGSYTVFPEGLNINRTTGAINISKSETGLRYKVSFTAENGEKAETIVLLSGVNYADHYHNLSQNDSLSIAVYNGGKALPTASFDIDGSARAQGLAIDPANGSINLKQTYLNGFFYGSNRRSVDVKYRVNDNSHNATNSISVLLYWYRTMNEVPEYLKQVLAARQIMFLRSVYPDDAVAIASAAAAKPRPPCVIVIAQ